MCLFNKLGGQPALSAAMEIFYGRMLNDPLLGPLFKGIKMDAQIRKQNDFFSSLLKGEAKNTVKYINESHAHLVRDHGMSDIHFDRTAMHLRETLDDLAVLPHVIEEVMEAVESLRAATLDRI